MKRAVIYTIYSLITLTAVLILSPYFIYLLVRRRKDEVVERLGLAGFADQQKLKKRQVIWLHGASVGELKAAGEVMRKLGETASDDYYFLVTAMTPQGRKLAREQLTDADHICFVPADFPLLVYLFLRRLQPDILLLLETELWPGLIRESIRRGARVAVFNGRISNDSFSSYRKIKFLLSPFVKMISRFYMQSRRDCDRIEELGAPGEKVERSGDIKYSGALEEAASTEPDFKLEGDRDVIVAGSTHEPEEDILLQVYKKLKNEKNCSSPLLVLAPRHVDRRKEILKLIKAEELNWQQRSSGVDRVDEETEVFLLDTIGELMGAYLQADIAFIGGTLADVGGHNFLEPLACDIPVLLGPNIYEIEGDLEKFQSLENGSSINLISGKNELKSCLLQIFERDDDFSSSALSVMRRESCRVGKQIEDIFSLLPFRRDNRKLLFIRLSALGDVIHTLPAFSLLGQKRPDYELHWLVEPLAAPLVRNNRYVDETIILPRQKLRGKKRLRGVDRLKKLRNFLGGLDEPDYDLTVDMHGILKSAVPLLFAGGDVSFGRCDGGEGSRFFYKRLLRYFSKNDMRHKIEENLELMASAIGCEVPGHSEIDYGLELPPEWHEGLPGELQELLGFSSRQANENNDRERALIGVVHPLSSWPSKNWLMERYRLLTRRMLKAGCKIIFSGSPDQRGRLQGIVDALKQENYCGRVYNAAGRIDLIELYGVFKRADFFLGADTGPMHLAAAAETEVAAIMGPTEPEVYGPYSSTGRVIRNEDLDCLACGKEKCPKGHHRCMQDLSVERVFQEIQKILPEKAAGKNEFS